MLWDRECFTLEDDQIDFDVSTADTNRAAHLKRPPLQATRGVVTHL